MVNYQPIDRDHETGDPDDGGSGWGCYFTDCYGDNTSDWQYDFYLAANESNGDLDHDELRTHSSNTWIASGFFTEEPTIEDDDAGCSIYDGGVWNVVLEEAEFRITYPRLDDNQTTLSSANHNPDSYDDSGNFSFSLSAGIGPISAGYSAAYYDGVNLTNDSYEETTWKFDYGLLGESDLPTSKSDSVGVRWDFEAESNAGWVKPRISHDCLFETVHTCSGPETVYTGMPELTTSDWIYIHSD